MGYFRKWAPSKTAAREFAQKMREIEEFCAAHGISAAASGDSFYFELDGRRYRVSNHTIESSNRRAFNGGEQIREKYHADGRDDDTIYIHASKTRIIEIYEKLQAGYELDGRGFIK